jgi:hypothetical protein
VQLLLGERHPKKKHRHMRVFFDWLRKRDSNQWNDPLGVKGMVSAMAKSSVSKPTKIMGRLAAARRGRRQEKPPRRRSDSARGTTPGPRCA